MGPEPIKRMERMSVRRGTIDPNQELAGRQRRLAWPHRRPVGLDRTDGMAGAFLRDDSVSWRPGIQASI